MRTTAGLLTVAVAAIAIVGLCHADAPPPRFLQFHPRAQSSSLGAWQQQEQQQQQQQPQQFEQQKFDGPPYAPAGRRPDREFALPSETTEPPPFNGDEDTTAPNTPNNGPYPPAGWRPAGRLLALPARLEAQQLPNDVYGAPAPAQEYGAPVADDEPTAEDDEDDAFGAEFRTTEASNNAGETNETTDEPESELLPNGALLSSNNNNQQQQFSGSLKKAQRLQRQRQQQQLQQQRQQQHQQQLLQLQQLSSPSGAHFVQLSTGAAAPAAGYYQFPAQTQTTTAALLAAPLRVQPVAVYVNAAGDSNSASGNNGLLTTAAKLQQTQPQPVLLYSAQLVTAPQSYSTQFQQPSSW